MITNPVELATQRRITRAFIDADYEMITLMPRTQSKSSSGGYKYTKGTPRAPQKFHVVERVTNAMPRTRVQGGDQREEDFTLVGNWDAQVAVHDIFDLHSAQWEVVAVAHPNGYEQRATVLRYGR